MKNLFQLKFLGLLLALIANTYLVSAATVTISGRILDSNGEPLFGATVAEKGTTNGVAADIDGFYTLEVDDKSLLIYQNVGFETQEMSIGNRTVINVSLSEEFNELDEVIVMAYGTKKKRDVVGSVAKVRSEDLTTVAGGNFQNALQGRAAGVQVVGGGITGDPQIKIRGVSSVSSGTDPLWVVDGIIGSSDIAMADIESIEVLKDASATAIYGSRGSNGVIIVTTKQATKGKIKVSANYEAGITAITKTDIGLANTAEYIQFVDAAKATAGLSSFDPYNDIMVDWTYYDETLTREEAMKINNNAMDAVTRMGSYQDAYVSVSGGEGNLSSFTSINYRDEKTVYEGFDKKKLMARMSSNYTKGDLKIGAEFKGRYYSDNDLSDFGSYGRYTWLPYYSDTSDSGYWNIRQDNPMANMDSDLNLNESDDLSGQIYGFMEYAPSYLKGFSVRADAKVGGSVTQDNKWTSSLLNDDGYGNTATRAKVVSMNQQYHLLLNYTKSINDHDFTLLAGLEANRTMGDKLSLGVRNIIGAYQEIEAASTYLAESTYGVLQSESYLFNYLTRLDYKYKDRYLFGASFVREGSSKFSEENRWGNFYSVSAGWIISDESFLKDTSWVTLLKLRGSMGQTGNQNIASSATITTYSSKSSSTYNDDMAIYMTTIPNKSVTWETTTSYDAGLDFGFFDNRLSGAVAYYRQNVDDMLTSVTLPSSAGIPNAALSLNNSIWANIGSMYNQGFEIDLTYRAVTKNNLSWSVSANFATNENKVTALDPSIDANGTGIICERPGTITRAGSAIGTYYMAEWAGVDSATGVGLIYEIDQDIFEATGETVKTGNKIPATQTNMANNKIIHEGKTGLPKGYGGLSANLGYKNLDFSLALSYSFGNYIYNESAAYSFEYANSNVYGDWYDNMWKQPGDNAKYPAAAYKGIYEGENYGYQNGSAFHDQSLEKADYLRLQNVTIGYTLPKRVLERIKIDNLRFYVSGSNLLTLTGYSGFDPEIQLTSSGGVQAAGIIFRGDVDDDPQIMTITAGINMKF